MPGVKPGSLDDVNAVGHREIGTRGLGNWYSPETEASWGAMTAQQILKSEKIVNDPAINQYVNQVGRGIFQNSDAQGDLIVTIIDAKQINAIALPGGYLFINSGLILAADNESQLAAVIAHEIAHVAAHHEAREMTRTHSLNASIVPSASWKFSRKFEEEADWLAAQYLYKAGYDPTQMVRFFEKMEILVKKNPGKISKTFGTHPANAERIARTQHEIATILPPRKNSIVDTPEFHAIQQRLIQIESH